LAENERDSLRLPLADLLFVHAEENYVRVHVRGERAAQPLLRSSLTRIERQLRPLYPRLFRCHRTCIVNMTQIAGVEGNAQGLKLTLKDSAAIVPVARRYVNEFRRALRAL
jgi:DNA-binding LytR/AlgR family response regulator